MSDAIDPYLQWLGIPPHEQPPNYYRLLDLNLYESDPEIIEGAANRCFKHVREVSLGADRKQVTEVLDQLLAAKRCLLVADRKQAYDEGLRVGSEHAERHGATLPPVAAPPVSKRRVDRDVFPIANASPGPVVPSAPVVSTKSRKGPRTATKKSLPGKRSPDRLLMGLTLSAILLGVGVWSAFGRRDPQQVPAPPQQIATTDDLASAKIVGTPPADPMSTEKQEDQPPVPANDTTLMEPATATDFEIPEEPALDIVRVASPEAAASRDKESTVVSSLPHEAASAIGATAPADAAAVDMVMPVDPSAARETTSSAVAAVRSSSESEERGFVLREVWRNVNGTSVDDFVQYVADHPEPTEQEALDRLEPPEDFADQYGQRLRGYLHVPTTGDYIFAIRANAEGCLFLGEDATPATKRRIEVGSKIPLRGGEAYYLEAYHKESTGRDYFQISWQLPDGTNENPVPGERLSITHRVAPRHEQEFVVLAPVKCESSTGSELQALDDGSILASGDPHEIERYELVLTSEIETVTALRIEALPHESLPVRGPGRGVAGRFGVAEVSVRAGSRNSAADLLPIEFSAVTGGKGEDLRRIVDGQESTVWRGSGRGQAAAAKLIVREPRTFPGGTQLHVVLTSREGLGCFRIGATSAREPQRLTLESADSQVPDEMLRLFVNLGGDSYTAPDGTRWLESKLFDNATFGHEGGRGVRESDVQNPVQASAQRGISAFRAIVPEGVYDVTLYFCEYWSTDASSRRFSIAAEQRPVALHLDLLRQAGGFAVPWQVPIRNVAVKDGRLDIEFHPATPQASAILNAISIQQVR